MGSASQVVGSLPHGEVFAAPVFHQVHQEQLAGGEIPENLVEIPVVQKQVIVQASPHVVGSLPPVAEFTSAGDTAENFAIFPVVQEQVLVGLRPAPPSEVAGPQGAAATGGYVAAGAPLLAVLSLRGFDGVDDITAKFLLQQALEMKEKEEEERVKREQEQLKRQEDQEEARLTRLQAERDALLVLGLETLSSQQKKRLNAVLDEREAILDRWERRRVVAKAKERRGGRKRRKRSSRRFLLTPLVAALVVDSGSGSVALLVLLVTMYLAHGFWKNFTRRSSSWPSPYSAQCLVRHWIHAFWYVAMCVSTAPVAEPTVMSFTVPLNGCTIDATATVVASFSRRQIPCCGGVCVAMSCGGGFFSPGGAYDSIWDSVKPMAGKYLIYYFQYHQFVGCICMLNYWFSSFDEICPDNYNYSRFKLKDKCRSAKWELFLYGVMTIKVDRGRVEVLPRGCAWPPRFFTQLGNVSHTIYGFACLLSVAWE